jgi:hypothetical protein
MFEYFIGFVIGGVLFFCTAKLDNHRHEVKRRMRCEEDFVLLRGHVEQAGSYIEKIINGSKG